MEFVYLKSRKQYLHCFQYLTLIAMALFSAVAFSQSSTTNIQVSSAVQQASVARLGINLGDQDYYDGGQMLKNLIFDNPGFEGMVYRSILTCGSSTANTCMDNNQYSPQPSGFWTGGTYQVVSGASMGVTGTILSSVQGTSCYGCGQVVTFDKNLSLVHNDYVIVRNTVTSTPEDGWWPSTSGGATLTADTTDLSPETPGKQALSMNASGSGQSANVTSWFDSWNNLSFIQLNGAFQLTFRAKGNGGSNQLAVSVQRLMAGLPTYLNKTVTLTNAWQDYTLTFTAAETGSAVGPVGVEFSASGSTVLLDDVSLTQTDSDPTNTTPFRDDVVNALKTLQPGVIRMMASYAALGADIPDQLAVPFARYREGYNTGSTEVDDIPYGIHEFLQLCAATGADPWLTVPTATTPQEMTEFVEYLTGNGSDPYSALRISRGQTAPWTSVFNKVHIELGNETWNGVFGGETMEYPPYPLWANQVFGAARQTSGYEASKFDLILSGWAASPGYTDGILLTSTQHDSIDIAPYLLYSGNNDTTTNLFQALFAEPEMFDTSGGEVYQNMQIANAAPTPTKLNVYEVNLGTMLGTITQTELNQLTPSVGAGVGTVDHMLQMMRLGVAYQNMFVLPQYQTKRTDGSTVQLWGTVVDMGTTNRRRPQFLAEQLANTAIFGDMLQTTQSGANPTWNQPLSSDSVQFNGAHEIQSFAFTNGTQSSLVLFNLTVGTSLPVTFSGTNIPNGTVNVGQLTSANITDSNETANTVQTVNSTVNNFNAASTFTLPPFSMTVLTWGGGTVSTAPTVDTPIFSAASGTYAGPVSVTISDTTAGATIYYTTNGTTPTTSSTKYTGPVTVSSTETLSAIAVVGGSSTAAAATAAATASSSSSAVASATYTIQQATAATPVFSQAGGSYTSAVSVSISDATAGAAIYYTTNGATPTASSTKYSGPVSISSTETLKAVAVASGFSNSAAASATYTISAANKTAATPVLSQAGGTYSGPVTVSISDTTPGVTILYSTNGTTSTKYTGPITISSTETLQAAATATGYTTSPTVSAAYTINKTAATPVFSKAAGTYSGSVTVTISDATPGATILYSTNGTTASKYTGPITISSTATLQAAAELTGFTTSPTVKAIYTISKTP